MAYMFAKMVKRGNARVQAQACNKLLEVRLMKAQVLLCDACLMKAQKCEAL